MAISPDAAAIAASNLTVAWAMRTGIVQQEPLALADGAILNTYFKYRDALTEVPIRDVMGRDD